MDAQFPNQFVQLAHGFKDLLQADEQVDELLKNGLKIAMSSAEYIEFADGYRVLKQDHTTAAELYEKGLTDVNDRDTLLALARTAANDLSNLDLAKNFYRKAESRVTRPGDLIKLAESIFYDVGDKDFATDIYVRAEAEIVGSTDLITLADHVMRNIGDKQKVSGLLIKSIDQATDFSASTKALGAIMTQLPDDNALRSSAIENSRQLADSASNCLAIHKTVLEMLADKNLADEILLTAEERVSTLADMKSVVQVVAAHNSEDREWNNRVVDKLKKRGENQSLYNTYQQREKSCVNSRQFLVLAVEVMENLEDPYYARTLLATAEGMLDQGSFDLSQYHRLVGVIDQKLDDPDWLTRLIRKMANRTDHLSETNQIATVASAITDSSLGKALALEVLTAAADKICDDKDTSTADFIKLAKSVFKTHAGRVLAEKLLEKAEAVATSYLELSTRSKARIDHGDQKSGLSLLEKAANACANSADLMKLVNRMKAYGLDSNDIRKTYSVGKELFAAKFDRIKWAKGLYEFFDDAETVQAAFDDLSESFSDTAADREMFRSSRLSRLWAHNGYTKPGRSIAW